MDFSGRKIRSKSALFLFSLAGESRDVFVHVSHLVFFIASSVISVTFYDRIPARAEVPFGLGRSPFMGEKGGILLLERKLLLLKADFA